MRSLLLIQYIPPTSHSWYPSHSSSSSNAEPEEGVIPFSCSLSRDTSDEQTISKQRCQLANSPMAASREIYLVSADYWNRYSRMTVLYTPFQRIQRQGPFSDSCMSLASSSDSLTNLKCGYHGRGIMGATKKSRDEEMDRSFFLHANDRKVDTLGTYYWEDREIRLHPFPTGLSLNNHFIWDIEMRLLSVI